MKRTYQYIYFFLSIGLGGISTTVLGDIDAYVTELIGFFQRPITILEVGDFRNTSLVQRAFKGSVYVSICDGPSPAAMPDACVHISRVLSMDDLKKLGECEHFDVVLISNHFLTKTALDIPVIENLSRLGDSIVFYGGPNLLASRGKSVGAGYVIEGTRKCITRQNICWPDRYGAEKTYTIRSSRYEKKLIKSIQNAAGYREIVTEWVPGINFLTFIYMGGGYPSFESLTPQILDKRTVLHKDWGPANMILQGSALDFIDFDDFHYIEYNPQVLTGTIQRKCDSLLQLISLKNSKDVFEFYWNVFNRTE